MELSVLVALVHRLIDERVEESKNEIQASISLRPRRGPRGFQGKDFDFEESQNEILNLITREIENRREQYKLRFADLSDDDVESLSLKYEKLSNDQKDILRGPRGFRGRKGKGFDFSEHREDIEQVLENLFDFRKNDLKLRFDDLTSIEKESLKLTFDNLSDEQKFELKGETGEKGSRGQKGKQGAIGEKGAKGFKGDKGDRGEHGAQGLPGESGERGFRGPQGFKGQNAPLIIDIEINKWPQDKISFIFTFDNGVKIETSTVDLPNAITIFQNMASSGGGGGTLIAFDEGVELGEFAEIDFVGPNIQASIVDDRLTVEVIDVPTESDYCIDVTDEGNKVTDCMRSIDFCGPNVEATTQTVIADWATLTEVTSMAGYEANNPGQVKVTIGEALEKVDSTGSGSGTSVGDSVPLADFISIKYFVAIRNTVTGKVMSFDMRVNNENGSLIDIIDGKVGYVDVAVEAVVNGSDMEVQIANNEVNDIDIDIYRLNN